MFYLAIVPIAIFNTLVGEYWDDPPAPTRNKMGLMQAEIEND